MGLRGRAAFGQDLNCLFLTTTVINFYPIFSLGRRYYLTLINSLIFVLKKYRGILFAYVLMPNHVHLVVQLAEGRVASDFMRDFKKFTSTQIRKQLEADAQMNWIERLRLNSPQRKGQVFKLWMDRFDDVVLYSESVFATKIEYIHNNPVKAGLVRAPEDWEFSSARNYILNDHTLIEVTTNW